MPAPAVHTVFGVEDFKIDARFLSHMAFLCSPDKPVETSTLIGSYAMCEICVSEPETADIMMYLDTLRSPGQQAYVGKVTSEMRQAAGASRNTAVAEAADAMDAEFARLKSVFFLRVRSFVVIDTETNETVGRVVTFPGQISDDYGNNLEEHSEHGANQIKVVRAHTAEELITVYIGHGQGAAMAQLCACASGGQAIVFDGTTLSELLVHNAVQHKCVKSEPIDDGVERDWHILHYRSEAWAKKQDATVRATVAAARKIDAEEKAANEAAREGKGPEAKKKGESTTRAAEKEDCSAEKWFKKCEWITVGGIIPVVAQCRFARTGRYNAKALSDMITDYTASMQAAEDPYA
ncbi:hypothetical protein, unknown function [Leishmania infantum JPCM5]|uniref:Uncharacterized protein n=2 Tax=Leishmania infantum TaxID=5671 RepID=A4I5R1_LEIIN|nr:hypothetical protein, unknown function [Leishmania infantum JPCM5]CAC9514605.1 hypothetical_protein_-_conserved [Leishmania infantum]CAM70132.1 hypothetical protein, unknown function [Leishmania infantum JPCM5]SUZ44052.1 hypothetical_protein_-_conserved [Leishmania infantum]|eukprot:XP_001467080.1 hypothetical protein, unknown function [Leishmania infantum JPCM5]